MISDRYWNLLAKYFSGEASLEEQVIIDEWRSKSVDNRNIFEFLQKIWVHKAITGPKVDIDIDKNWLDTREKLEARGYEYQKYSQPKKPKEQKEKGKDFFRVGKVSKYAAAAVFLMVAVIGGIFLYQYQEKVFSESLEYMTEVGQTLKLKLEDGSEIWLAPKSALNVPSNFNGSKRELRLDGEAYFLVESKQNKPFRIYTKNSITKVLGTKFNVMALADESLLEVQVTEGVVAVEKSIRNQSEGDIILKEGDMLQTDEQLSTYNVKHNVQTFAHSKWMDGVIHLDDLPLTRISERLERWYPVQIILESENLSDKRLTAEFSSDQPLEEIMDEISLALNIDYKLNQQTVIFY